MATTSIWRVKGWLGKVVIYVENPDKTDNPAFVERDGISEEETHSLADVIQYAIDSDKTHQTDDEHAEIMQNFVSGVNCYPATAREEMMAVKKRFGKEGGTVAYHGYQSFAPGEVTPEIAHEIGVKLAQQLWGAKYQLIVATHLDKDSHLHNHFVVNSTKLSLAPDVIKADTDVAINMFDSLQIITSKGVLTEDDLKSTMIVHLVAYLTLHKDRPAQPLEIFHALWPAEDDERAGVKIKSVVYRFQQVFCLISDYRLIESSPTGYRFNPELHVITDLDCFTGYWNQAQVTVNLVDRGQLLKKAMEIYKNGLLPAHSGEHWLMPSAAHYSLRYMGIVNQLLSTLNKANDYVCIHEYASIAVRAVPGSLDAHYWLTYAMLHLGSTEMARNELRIAKQVLTTDDYYDMLRRLNIDDPEKIG